MAGLAQIAGRDMRYRFTPGVEIVVTAIAADAGHLGAAVIDDRVGEGRRVMAGDAVLGGRNVVVGFIVTDHPVVAGGTGVQIQVTGRMIESARSECARGMAGGAVLGGCQVSQRWSRFPGGNKAIVAAIATHTGYRGVAMIDAGAEKILSVMTSTAILASRYMNNGFADIDDVVVAGRTAVLIEVSRSMIEGTRGEATRRMTDHTVLNCCQMARGR